MRMKPSFTSIIRKPRNSKKIDPQRVTAAKEVSRTEICQNDQDINFLGQIRHSVGGIPTSGRWTT